MKIFNIVNIEKRQKKSKNIMNVVYYLLNSVLLFNSLRGEPEGDWESGAQKKKAM